MKERFHPLIAKRLRNRHNELRDAHGNRRSEGAVRHREMSARLSLSEVENALRRLEDRTYGIAGSAVSPALTAAATTCRTATAAAVATRAVSLARGAAALTGAAAAPVMAHFPWSGGRCGALVPQGAPARGCARVAARGARWRRPT